MKIRTPHSWSLTPTEAVALQKQLAGQIDTRTPLAGCELIAGADISYNRFSPIFYAAVVVLRTDDWTIVETQTAVRETRFPYVPGLLSFREAPAVLDAFAKVRHTPDAVMFDGAGFAHPRRFGLACHLGWCLDTPSLGCAKTVLVGKSKEPGRKRGCLAPLKDEDEVIGMAVRTKEAVKPVYVSVGHKIDLASAVRLVLECSQGYRLPEPTRQAHLHVNALRREASG
jgi:deoxyribonuclease V